VFNQGKAGGGATFDRLEGCWYGDGSVFFNSTSGGDAGLGQVWEYRPRGSSGGQLILVFESEDADLLEKPDNITVSPRGGLLLCEDGGGTDFLRGVNPEGQIFDFARNDLNNAELAGATYSPGGDTLFVNIQSPGITFAITGPFEKGAL
jgi:secreted PhoX family phosphatase